MDGWVAQKFWGMIIAETGSCCAPRAIVSHSPRMIPRCCLIFFRGRGTVGHISEPFEESDPASNS